MSWRFERKIGLGSGDVEAARDVIKLHTIGLRTAYPNRTVRNVYFDTLDYFSFHAHVMGVESRAKWRLRAYDESPWQSLEEKRKRGDHGEKLKLDPTAAIAALGERRSAVIAERELYPVLENSYEREYFESPVWGIRVTLDTNLRFRAPGQTSWLRSPDTAGVLEIKYDLENVKNGDAFLRSLPWRVSRYSKYIQGVRILDICS